MEFPGDGVMRPIVSSALRGTEKKGQTEFGEAKDARGRATSR